MQTPPPDSTPSIAEDFKAVARTMRAEINVAVARAQPHRGEVGTAVEAALRVFFDKYLPGRFSVGSGFIRDTTGRRSRQCDLVVNDDSVFPSLPYAEGRSLYLAESAAAVVEVTKTLDRPKIKECVERAKDLRALRRSGPRSSLRIVSESELAYPDAVPYFVFALDSPLPLAEAGGHWAEVNESMGIDHPSRIDAFAILDVGLLLWVRPEGDDLRVALPGEYYTTGEVALAFGEDTLLFFFAHVLNRLPKVVFAPPNLERYLPTGKYPLYAKDSEGAREPPSGEGGTTSQ